MTRRPMVLTLVSLVVIVLLASCGSGQSPIARVATCFQHHGWLVVKRSGSTLDVRQAGDEIVLNFHNGIVRSQTLGDAIAMRTLDECSP